SLRELSRAGCRVTVVPASTSANEVFAMKPDGVFLSNGPGDPASMNKEVAEVKQVAESARPMFGICFGHQLRGRGLGGNILNRPFAPRGATQPVSSFRDAHREIPSQNRCFAVQAS